MNLISYISFAISLFVLITFFFKKSDVLSPVRIFVFIWAFVIGITNLKLSYLQHEWQPIEWINILIGPVAFVVGAAIVYALYVNQKIWVIDSLRENREIMKVDMDKLFKAITLLFILFVIGYIAIVIKVGTVPILSSRPGKIRAMFSMFGVGLFLHNVVLIVFFSAIYFIYEKNNKAKKYWLGFFSFASFMLYAITLQRYQLFLSIFMVLVLLYYTTFRIKFRMMFIFSVIIIVFFLAVSSVRAGELIVFVLYKFAKMKFSPKYALFTEPYMYFAMNLENFGRSILRLENFTYGYYTFDFITAITGIKHWIEKYFALNETPFLNSDFNTYSAMFNYYRDFGTLGVTLIPLIGGAALNALYYSFRKNPTLLKLAFFGMFLFGIAFSFFNSPFGFLWYVYNLAVIFFVFLYVKPNSLNNSKEK